MCNLIYFIDNVYQTKPLIELNDLKYIKTFNIDQQLMKIAKIFIFILSLLPNFSFATNGEIRILFIGNSITNRNDLPSTFAKYVAKAYPNKKITTEMIAPDGQTLFGHHQTGKAQATIETKKWDYIVLQEGSDIVPTFRLNSQSYALPAHQFYEEAKYFIDIAKAHNATPILLQYWYLDWRFTYMDHVIAKAATENHISYAPTGRVVNTLPTNIQQQLLAKDGLHPSVLGTNLMAITLAQTLFGPTNIKKTKTELNSLSIDNANMIINVITEQVNNAKLKKFSHEHK